MTPEAIATIILAAVALLGITAGAIGWFFKRGGDERAMATALSDNTSATRELTTQFRDFKDSVVEKLHGLDVRVTRLEIQPPPVQVTTKVEAPSHASTSPDRDAGTPG
jgi:type II secretory pathway pseudopilin PulG